MYDGFPKPSNSGTDGLGRPWYLVNGTYVLAARLERRNSYRQRLVIESLFFLVIQNAEYFEH